MAAGGVAPLRFIFARFARRTPLDLAQDVYRSRAELLGIDAGDELAQQFRHRWRLGKQRPVTHRQIATDHPAVAVDQAMRQPLDAIRECPRRGRGTSGKLREVHAQIVMQALRYHQHDAPRVLTWVPKVRIT